MAENQPTAAEICREAGLDSLAELETIVGKPARTLNNWYADNPDLFKAVVLGAAQIKTGDQELFVVAVVNKSQGIKVQDLLENFGN